MVSRCLSQGALAATLFLSTLSGCGADTALTEPEKLVIAMLGSYTAPADAAGNAEPRHQTYTLIDVTGTASDGSVIDFFDDEPTSIRIVNRSQIIHEVEIAAYARMSFSQISVQFAPNVTGLGKFVETLSTSLASPTLTLVETFTVESAASIRLTIEAQWKNTVQRDETADPPETMTPPSFLLKLKPD